MIHPRGAVLVDVPGGPLADRREVSVAHLLVAEATGPRHEHGDPLLLVGFGRNDPRRTPQLLGRTLDDHGALGAHPRRKNVAYVVRLEVACIGREVIPVQNHSRVECHAHPLSTPIAEANPDAGAVEERDDRHLAGRRVDLDGHVGVLVHRQVLDLEDVLVKVLAGAAAAERVVANSARELGHSLDWGAFHLGGRRGAHLLWNVNVVASIPDELGCGDVLERYVLQRGHVGASSSRSVGSIRSILARSQEGKRRKG